ncbi:DNA primase [Paraglaciecola aquimarina]|uniref:DNA primase n=1 Tax=Paraglaciecola aquimarina TaxID=1235557 RepID=A0ABU3SW75_9ALTE|nr:DNA primase [Paraglaciecola aquimarina]MDU0354245.1 DNA primase [Paraglaciecola aquimarina]
MSGRIPREFIDDIIARSDIVELIDSRVSLKKAGRNYQACCPFHNEKSPSFTVSQDKQFYHCFGCGAHGNVITFLMEFDRLEFPEAIEELAQYHSVEVPREKGGAPALSKEQKQQKGNDYELMEKVTKYFAQQLKNHPQKDKAIDYLKGRGLSGEVVKAFDMGYAPPDWDSVLKTFGINPEAQQQLLDLKLITENDNRRRFDFFRDRIMFPIRDKRGRVIGFGGRVLEDGGPKYLNSPETRIFHKGHELYGFYQAKQAHRNLAKVMIVEGYMDVVALGQFGIDYAVASLGTATTAEHIQMLFRATSEIICCYDGDRAGREAAWRALENALPYLKDGVQMKFLFLPDGEDPDTLIRKIGKQAFEQQLQSDSVPLSKFFFNNLLQHHHVSSNEGKAALKAEAMPLIEQIVGDNIRASLLADLSSHMGEHNKHKLESDIANANRHKGLAKQDFKTPNKSTISPVRMMIRLLLDDPSLATTCSTSDPSPLLNTSIQGVGMLNELFQYCKSKPTANTAQVLEYFRGHPASPHLAKLLSWEYAEQNQQAVFEDSFTKLLDWHLQGRMDELFAKSRTSFLTNEEKQELNLLVKEQK